MLADLVGLRWVALAAGTVLLADALSLQRRGALWLLDVEVPGDGGTTEGTAAGPVADDGDSGDDWGDAGRD